MTPPMPEPDRPAFEVRVAGSAIAPLAAADVVEIDVHEEVGRHGRCSLLVQNWNADTRTTPCGLARNSSTEARARSSATATSTATTAATT